MNIQSEINHSPSSPKFQDKEERRLIIIESLGNLLRFHEIERQEKNSALKFYSAFVAGGVALAVTLTKLTTSIEISFIKFVSIAVIVIVNYLMIKKLLAVRIASNNIYQEYGARLEYLINNHMSDLNQEKRDELYSSFSKYYGKIKSDQYLLPKYSADKHEIYGLYIINVIFSLSFVFPIYELFSYFFTPTSSGTITPDSIYTYFFTALTFTIIEIVTIWFGYSLIENAKSAPGYKN